MMAHLVPVAIRPFLRRILFAISILFLAVAAQYSNAAGSCESSAKPAKRNFECSQQYSSQIRKAKDAAIASGKAADAAAAAKGAATAGSSRIEKGGVGAGEAGSGAKAGWQAASEEIGKCIKSCETTCDPKNVDPSMPGAAAEKAAMAKTQASCKKEMEAAQKKADASAQEAGNLEKGGGETSKEANGGEQAKGEEQQAQQQQSPQQSPPQSPQQSPPQSPQQQQPQEQQQAQSPSNNPQGGSQEGQGSPQCTENSQAPECVQKKLACATDPSGPGCAINCNITANKDRPECKSTSQGLAIASTCNSRDASADAKCREAALAAASIGGASAPSMGSSGGGGGMSSGGQAKLEERMVEEAEGLREAGGMGVDSGGGYGGGGGGNSYAATDSDSGYGLQSSTKGATRAVAATDTIPGSTEIIQRFGPSVFSIQSEVINSRCSAGKFLHCPNKRK